MSWSGRRSSAQPVLATGWLLALVCCATRTAAQAPALPDTVERFIRSELARQRIPGMSVAILRGDSVLLAQGYGLADVKRKIPATDSTLFAIGSVTKQFTAAAIVLLSQQGRLRLDDPVTRYLPEGKSEWSGVTIRHLLTHTSGIPEDTTVDMSRNYTEQEMVRSALQPLQFKPGSLESYCSSCYALLGVVIHRVTGVFWGNFVRDQIFRPVGMATARVNTETTGSPAASGYYLGNDTLQSPDPVSPSLDAAADCCLSLSARDFARWAIGLNHAKVLGGNGLKQIWTPVRLNNGGTYPYGLGWNLFEQRGYRRIGHSGAWQGCHATIQRYPDFDLTVIVLLNLGQANSEGVAVGIAGLVEPALAAPHLVPGGVKGAKPPASIDRLLRAIADGKEAPLVTPEFAATFPSARRPIVGSFLQAIDTWTHLGCDAVGKRGISRLRSRIEHICYTKGSAKAGSLLFTVLYDGSWRAAGLDNVFGI